jgi:hypothetical protein
LGSKYVGSAEHSDFQQHGSRSYWGAESLAVAG